MTNLVGELTVRPLIFLLGNVRILKNKISFVDKNKTEHIIGEWVACILSFILIVFQVFFTKVPRVE